MILEETLKNLEVGIRGGGNLVKHRPLFTKDSRHLLVTSDDTVHIYSTESGDIVTSIQTPNSSSIANIVLTSSSATTTEDLIIFTETGDLLEVSLQSYEITSNRNINPSIPKQWTRITQWLNITLLSPGNLLLMGHTENEAEVMLYKATRDVESKKGKYRLQKLSWKILPTSHAVSVGVSGELVVAIQEDSVFMTNVTTGVAKWHKSGTRTFTCVAAHPHDWIVATGDDSGRILVWRNFLEEKSPAKAVFHWHTLPVADLCFSTDGSKLLSGGSECCLVRWDTADCTDRKILPRMGLPIRHLSVAYGNTLVAVSHADNCIQLVDDGNKIIRVIQNITQCYIPLGADDRNVSERSLGGRSVFQAGLTHDPNRKSLVMNGKPGHLQCYSLRENKHLYNLDITQQNYVTADRKKTIPNADVTHVAFSSHGMWLSTVESLVDGTKCHELRLKFWKFDQQKQIFVLNTSINWPHENDLINLRIQPGKEDTGLVLCATAGGDRRFKTWGLVHNTSIHGKSEWWTCENVGSYREQKTGPLTFSSDGSVLAVPFGHTLTLWKTEVHELSGALAHSKLRDDIRMAEFSSQPTSNLVVCATAKDLIVWDVITLSLIWRVPLAVESLAVDSVSNLVAVFSTKKHLYFFKPDIPEPLAVHKSVSQSKIISSIFVPNPDGSTEIQGLKSMLIFINASQELCGMQSRHRRNQDGGKSIRIQKGISTLTPFAKLLPEKSVSKVKGFTGHGLQGNVVGIPGAQVIRQMMDISPHTMPSISYFCNQFLSSISHRVTPSEQMDSVSIQPSKSYTVPSDSDSESGNESEDILSEDELFYGPGRKKSKERKELVEKPIEMVEIVEPVSSLANQGVVNRTLKIDLDSVANDDISWIREGIAVTK